MIKAASHIHSDWSYDGSWPLPRLAKAFAARGYHLLLMTEHDRGFSAERLVRYREACAEASSDKITLIPGLEYSDAENLVHILVWGDLPFFGENLPTTILLRAVHDAGGIAVMAHPTRRHAWKSFDADWSNYLLGIELWNRKTDGWAPSQQACNLLRGSSLQPFLGLDFHTSRQFFPLALNFEGAMPPTEAGVHEALRDGTYRATALGKELTTFAQGFAPSVLRFAEFHRRGAARIVRSLTK